MSAGCRDAGRRLGAQVIDGCTRFEVWAPNAESVDVVIETDGRDVVVPLEAADRATNPNWTWLASVNGVGDGARYRFRLDGGTPLADPASRLQPDGVHGPSAVVDPGAFRWTDGDWHGVALADTVLYEVHVGTFTPGGTFDSAIDQLDRLVDLGVTVVEIMPVAAFPGERNWGYDGVFPFATQASYGGPAAFARFVDAAHARGLGVVLDVVYNHFGPEGNVLPEFGPYLTSEYSTPWGDAVNVAGRDSDPVRRYLIENAVGWIRDFHLDGLRLDAVHAIVDPTARPFVAELTAAVHDAGREFGRTVLVTIESADNDPRIVRDRASNGWGCDAVWDDDVHHALRVALTGEQHEYYAGYDGVPDLAEAWEHRFVYHGRHSVGHGRRHGADARDVDHRHFIAFSQNHDHNGNTPRGERLLHGGGPADPRLRLAAAAILLSPFTPMLFMGEEYAEPAPFPYFVDHGDPDLVRAVQEGRQREFSGADWHEGVADPADPATYAAAVLDPSIADGDGPHAEMLDLYRTLLRTRRERRVLTDPTATQEVERSGRVIVVRRRLDGVAATLTLNFSDDDQPDGSDGEIVVDTSGSSGDTIGAHGARLRLSTPS